MFKQLKEGAYSVVAGCSSPGALNRSTHNRGYLRVPGNEVWHLGLTKWLVVPIHLKNPGRYLLNLWVRWGVRA
jgi:hypothetical protein